jgi:hypothetical protein
LQSKTKYRWQLTNRKFSGLVKQSFRKNILCFREDKKKIFSCLVFHNVRSLSCHSSSLRRLSLAIAEKIQPAKRQIYCIQYYKKWYSWLFSPTHWTVVSMIITIKLISITRSMIVSSLCERPVLKSFESSLSSYKVMSSLYKVALASLLGFRYNLQAFTRKLLYTQEVSVNYLLFTLNYKQWSTCFKRLQIWSYKLNFNCVAMITYIEIRNYIGIQAVHSWRSYHSYTLAPLIMQTEVPKFRSDYGTTILNTKT